MKKIISALALTMILGACSTQTVFVNGTGGALKKEDMQTFFVSGLGQTQAIDAAAVCGGAANVAKVERVEAPLNILLRFLTAGIYSPVDAKVYCTK
jgi:Bor protein